MIRVVRSYIVGMRASMRYGRACGLLDKGRKSEALVEARAVLKLLAKPYVIRTNPGEASLLMCTTVLLESLAYDLGQQGAREQDLSDTLSCIRPLGVTHEWAPWIPYLEARLGQGEASGV